MLGNTTNNNATVNNANMNMEGTDMMNNTTTYAVDYNADNNVPNGDAEQAVHDAKEQMGKAYTWLWKNGAGVNQKYDQWKKDNQKNINIFTASFGLLLGALDMAGLKPLRKEFMRLFTMAQKGEITVSQLKDELVKLVMERLEFLDGLTNDASLKQCATLKAIVTKDGKKYGEKSIIELIFAVMLWIIKRTYAKLKEVFGIPESKMPGIVKFVWGLIKAVFEIILTGGRLVFSIALPGICFVFAGVLKALAWIYNWVCGLWNQAKAWFTGATKKATPSDETVSTAQTVVNAEAVEVPEFDAGEYADVFNEFDDVVENVAADVANA